MAKLEIATGDWSFSGHFSEMTNQISDIKCIDRESSRGNTN